MSTVILWKLILREVKLYSRFATLECKGQYSQGSEEDVGCGLRSEEYSRTKGRWSSCSCLAGIVDLETISCGVAGFMGVGGLAHRVVEILTHSLNHKKCVSSGFIRCNTYLNA